MPAYAGGAEFEIWNVEAQKVVPDLPTALRRGVVPLLREVIGF